MSAVPVLCAATASLLLVLPSLIWDWPRRRRDTRDPITAARLEQARARHPAGRRTDRGSVAMWAEMDALEDMAARGREAEGFSADREDRP